MSKTALFAGCARSNLTVYPANWEKLKATTFIPWRISYRFYDPATRGTKHWGMQVVIRGMNEYKGLEDRQAATRTLLAYELHALDVRGFNPVTGQYMAEPDVIYEIDPQTPFMEAMRLGMKKVTATADTLKDLEYILNGVERAAKLLYDPKKMKRYNMIPVCEIGTRHIKYILEQCVKINPRFSNNTYNRYKAYLSMVFRELKEVEAIENNPTRDISNRKKTHRLRSLLTKEDQVKIDSLKEKHYNFWRYIQIFFHSGSRTTEMLALKKEHVNIERQEFIVTVKKGKSVREHLRLIPNNILYLWKEVYAQAGDGQYLFGRLLQPGDKMIRKDQLLRRWNKYVRPPESKGGLNINKNFYWLKHSHTDLVAAAIDLQHAQALDGHTNQDTTKLYALGEDRRMKERVKNLDIKFG